MDRETDRHVDRRPESADAGDTRPEPPSAPAGESPDESPRGRLTGGTGGTKKVRRRVLRRTLLALSLLLLPLLTAETALRIEYAGTPGPGA